MKSVFWGLLILASILTAVSSWAKWSEVPTNPVFDPTSGRAYYPAVVYDRNAFSGHGENYKYKIWYGTSTATGLAGSPDGINWTIITNAIPGVKSGNVYHNFVLYDTNQFNGTGYYYKMWYWDSAYIYNTNAMRTADSIDGRNWTNDRPISQNPAAKLITGNSADWNYGTYVSPYLIFNPSASNAGIDPFGYSYAMYYDAATGSSESIALAYSQDGIHWSLSIYTQVFKAKGSGWEVDFASTPSIHRDNDGTWHMWYSGGDGSLNEGIGYAQSSNGINWTRLEDVPGWGFHASPVSVYSNPLLYTNDGPAWRSTRSYTPCVLYDADRFGEGASGHLYKMWYTGCDSGGNYAIGLATSDPPENVFPLTQTVSNGQIYISWNVPQDLDNDRLQFEFQFDTTNTFNSTNLVIRKSFSNTGFEYTNGGAWTAWNLTGQGGILQGAGRVRTSLDMAMLSISTNRPSYCRVRAMDYMFKGNWELKKIFPTTNGTTNTDSAQSSASDLSGAIAGPNPYRPGKSLAGGITFRRLPPGSIVKVYTITGRKAAEFSDEDNDGVCFWQVPSELASGVYLCHIRDSNGHQTVLKIIVVK